MTNAKPMLLGDLASLFTPQPADYYKALGSFVSTFARVECELNFALWHLAKIHPRTAKVVLGETRIKHVIAAIRRVKNITNINADEWNDVDKSLSQMNVITNLRNDILHYGSTLKENDTHTVTNESFAVSPESIRTLIVSSNTLAGAEHDLTVILLSLFVLRAGDDFSQRDEAQALVRSHAWRYKQPPQQNQKRQQGKRQTQ